MKNIKKTNVLKFPNNLTQIEREVEAIIFAAAEPLDIDTIESKISKKADVKKILGKLKELYINRGIKYMVEGIEATYMDFTRKTAKYPKRREKEYLMIGLMNEAGEVGGAFKKEIRDKVDNTELIIDEMGDVLWYLTRLCDVYDTKISELMSNNIDKLFARMTKEQAEAYRASLG